MATSRTAVPLLLLLLTAAAALLAAPAAAARPCATTLLLISSTTYSSSSSSLSVLRFHRIIYSDPTPHPHPPQTLTGPHRLAAPGSLYARAQDMLAVLTGLLFGAACGALAAAALYVVGLALPECHGAGAYGEEEEELCESLRKGYVRIPDGACEIAAGLKTEMGWHDLKGGV